MAVGGARAFTAAGWIYGLDLSLVLAVMLVVGAWLAQQPTAVWLGGGMGLLVVGWVIELVGHY